ncbi:Alpha/Beta hydrolase protein [Trichoderma sp. SZMC 28013]
MQDTAVSPKEELLRVIAEELGMDLDDLSDDTDISHLQNDTALSRLILKRVPVGLQDEINRTTFRSCTDIADLKAHIDKVMTLREPLKPLKKREAKLPIILLLRGNEATAKKKVFLLPDGSGSGMAYMSIPPIDSSICLYGINSPYLHSPEVFNGTINDLAQIWTAEIQKIQPHGPYSLGGWSAGGYFSFEVSKLLINKGERVEKLILIDSPCRLLYEALPTTVVECLAKNNLMGNWSDGGTPGWLVNSFVSTIGAVEKYMPTPMVIPDGAEAPEVFIIWASDGVFPDGIETYPELDMSVRVTRFLVNQRTEFGPLGWDELFPGQNITIAKMPGSHFMIVHQPNVDALGKLLQDVIQGRAAQTKNNWQVWQNKSG